MRSIWSAVAVVAGCAWSSALAQQKVEIGILTCNLSKPADTEPGGVVGAAQERHILCAFTLKNGPEETYSGKAEVVSLSAAERGTLLWSVRVPSPTLAAPGLLEQSYAADPRTPRGQLPRLIGEQNSEVVLQSIRGGNVGMAGASERSQAARRFAVVRIELKLKSSIARCFGGALRRHTRAGLARHNRRLLGATNVERATRGSGSRRTLDAAIRSERDRGCGDPADA